MGALRVPEFIRDPDAVWNLPAAALERLGREFPDVAFDCSTGNDRQRTHVSGFRTRRGGSAR